MIKQLAARDLTKHVVVETLCAYPHTALSQHMNNLESVVHDVQLLQRSLSAALKMMTVKMMMLSLN